MFAELLGLDQAPARGDGVDDAPGPRGAGSWPILPAAYWSFCARIALAMSVGVTPSCAILSGRSQIAHRVVARAEDRDVGHAGNALQLVEDVDRGVVATDTACRSAGRWSSAPRRAGCRSSASAR